MDRDKPFGDRDKPFVVKNKPFVSDLVSELPNFL